ncbi:hypothetical protein [Lysobacter gummosus]|uniref:hypothetical protein n=1 Tax=Lysobacter gummosus TaxID=262324 RepID=UPI00362AD895
MTAVRLNRRRVRRRWRALGGVGGACAADAGRGPATLRRSRISARAGVRTGRRTWPARPESDRPRARRSRWRGWR